MGEGGECVCNGIREENPREEEKELYRLEARAVYPARTLIASEVGGLGYGLLAELSRLQTFFDRLLRPMAAVLARAWPRCWDSREIAIGRRAGRVKTKNLAHLFLSPKAWRHSTGRWLIR